ncbi:MAG: hypothetical protein OES24_03175 [Acidimicrobiia bacterium]|nr:hypothetical protein [Acidimicrobiia bacterium]
MIANNLIWSVTGEAVRLTGSFAAFLVLVRVYPPADFGLLVSATALFATVFPLASVGGGWLLLQRVTKDRWSPERALATASGLTVTGSLLVGASVLVVRPVILPQMPALLFAGVAVAELLLMGLVEVTLFAAQATERLAAKAAAWSVYGIGRAVAAAVLLATVDRPGLGLWIVISIGVSGVVLVVAQVATVGRLVGPSRPRRIDVREGLPYSVGFGAERLLATTDSVLLVRFDFTADAGLYAAGRRLLTVSLAPCFAALHAVSARLWRAGARSVVEARTLAIRFTVVGSAYGIVTMVGWLLAGDLAIGLLGSSYEQTAAILPWLSVVPLLTVLEIFAGTALTGSGHHHRRVLLTIGAGLLNLVLNLAWIPGAGWRGAIAASLVSSAVFVVSLWLVLAWACTQWQAGDRKERRRP